MIEARRFHSLMRRLQRMVLKTTGLMIRLETKLLIVGDSVMGCLAVYRETSTGQSGLRVLPLKVTLLSMRDNRPRP
jgi:hypothetical protein